MISIYKPTKKDLWFRALMLSDKDTMAYNHKYGGTIEFKNEDWDDWYDYWLLCDEKERLYRYVKNDNGDFVGEIAYHFDKEINNYVANVIIYAIYRNQGYGSDALDILCKIAKTNGINVLYDDIAIDNSAYSMFLKHGFFEEYRTEEKIYLKKVL